MKITDLLLFFLDNFYVCLAGIVIIPIVLILIVLAIREFLKPVQDSEGQSHPSPIKISLFHHRFFLIGLGLVMICGLGYYYYYGPCGLTRVSTAYKAMGSILDRLDGINTLASSTPYTALSGPVSQMQSLRRDLDAIDVPMCLISSRAYLSDAIDQTNKTYLALMSKNLTFNYLLQASIDIGHFQEDISRVNACKPFCAFEMISDPHPDQQK
jgi:hypothetical protein